MFRTLCVVYGLLISLNTKQERVSILIPYSNRDQEGLEDVIGNFVTALPVSVACSRDACFQDILQEFKRLYLVLTSHTAMPFERLSKEFDFLARPLTMVEFIYHNYPQRPIRFDDLEVTPVEVEVETAGYDMELHLWDTHHMDTGERENKGELRAEFYYNSSCFRESTARNVPGCFQSLLEAVIADPRRPLSQLEEGLYRIKRER
jgi:non-ribosomal peptide synthetase component F